MSETGLALGVVEERGAFTVGEDGAQTLLGAFREGETTVGLAFTPSGDIVGYSDGVAGRTAVAYDGSWSALSGLETGAAVIAVGLDGAIIGADRRAGMATAFRIEGTGAPTFPFSSDRPSVGNAGGAAGEVVGSAVVDLVHSHALVLRKGVVEHLGTLGGSHSTALAINARG